MIITMPRRLLPWTLSLVALLLPATARSAEPDSPLVVVDAPAGWRASFDGRSSTLQCRHSPSGTSLTGRLSFTVVRDGKRATWSVQPAGWH